MPIRSGVVSEGSLGDGETGLLFIAALLFKVAWFLSEPATPRVISAEARALCIKKPD